jgi:quercetin dioxygenase-like cupin family protein
LPAEGEEDGVALHIHDEELPGNSTSRTFLGRDHGAVPVSFFIQASPTGHGPEPHRHPYAEVFVLHEGSGSFLAGDRTIEASGGSVVVVPAGEVHGFTASSDGPLRMTCIHTNDVMITEWVQPD